jgi:hypothetical protein
MGGATVAAKALRVALLATGIGAIIAAVTFLIPLISDWASGTEDLKKKQDDLNASLKQADEDLANYTSEIEFATKKQILLAKQLGASNETIRAIEKQGRKDELAELEKDYWAKLKLREEAGKIDVETFDKANEALIESQKKYFAKSQENELKDVQDKIDAQKEVDDSRKLYDEKRKERDAKRKAELEKQKQDNQKEFDETFAQLEKEMTLEFEATERFNERELKANQDRLDAEKAADEKAKADKKLADEKATQAYIDNIMARQSIAQSSFDIISNLGELAIGQQFKQTALGKTLALAQIATDTAVAISSAGVAAAKATAATGNPLSGMAVYVTTVAGILANVLRAKSILSGGGASGGSSGSGNGGGTGPQQNSNPPSITGFTRGTDAQGNPITKVVVLEKDITNSQARVARIRTNAELI